MSSTFSHPSPVVIPLWPEGAPGSEDWPQTEKEDVIPAGLKVVRNVAQPTLTAYLPDPATASGTAVVICPGGAYHFLAVEHEGTAVARWLNAHGIAAFLLKYRLIRTGDDFPEIIGKNLGDRGRMAELMTPLIPLIIADGQQAVRLVRQRAAEWGIAADRIGMMGFSAGGMVTVNVALLHDASSRPDFAAAIYFAGRQDVPVPDDAPPMFILCTDNDQMSVPLSLSLYSDWRAAGRPVELHIYAQGSHGFGMIQNNLPTDTWIERFYEWLQAQGLVEIHR